MSNKMKDDSISALAPKLRFPEFRGKETWKAIALSELAERCNRKNSSGELKLVLTNSAEYGVVEQRDYFDKDIAVQGNLSNYFVVEIGDYVYNPRISKAAPVGPISKNKIGTGVMSPLYTVFRFKSKSNDFYARYFKTVGWHSYMRQISSTGARHDRMSVGSDDFMAMPVPVSLPEEQQKIVDCFDSVDELIDAQNKKILALKIYRKGMLQQLFPRAGEFQPRLRFPKFKNNAEWETGPLASIFDTTSGGTPSRSVKQYWDGEIPWVTTSLVDFRVITDAEEFITDEGLKNSSAKLFPKGTVLIAMYGQGKTRGQAALLGVDAATNQACAAILPKEGIDPHFTFLSMSARYEELRKLSNSGGQENLSQSLIKEISFSYPPDEAEQQAISSCLSSLDTLIHSEHEKLKYLNLHKKGLMQQLFPGSKKRD